VKRRNFLQSLFALITLPFLPHITSEEDSAKAYRFRRTAAEIPEHFYVYRIPRPDPPISSGWVARFNVSTPINTILEKVYYKFGPGTYKIFYAEPTKTRSVCKLKLLESWDLPPMPDWMVRG
jgi:hypothetical protein